jgi:transcription initiation factor TFIID subunit 2
LHSSAIIDQVYDTRKVTAHAVASQFYGCFITTEKWSDLWLKKGISKYLAGLFVKKIFGNNEYRAMIHEEMARVVSMSNNETGLIFVIFYLESNNEKYIRSKIRIGSES